VTSVGFALQQQSVLVTATVNDQAVQFVLDTGDAIGPVFTAADAARLKLVQGEPFGVEGAGGASTSYQTTANITFDDRVYLSEPAAIDGDLEGNSLLGLPFFVAKCPALLFDFNASQLTLIGK
jgi:hypothetical protein